MVKDADGDDADSNFEDPEVTSPSSSVTYRVIIDNDSAVPMTIVSLSDDIYDPVTCLDSSLENVVGQTLAADDGDGASPPNGGQDEIACTFVETAPSSDGTTVIDTVTVEAQGSGLIAGSDEATIQTATALGQFRDPTALPDTGAGPDGMVNLLGLIAFAGLLLAGGVAIAAGTAVAVNRHR